MSQAANQPGTPTGSPRLDHLDAVRAFALLLGVVFHASMSFLPIYIGWAVMDVSTSPVIGSLMLVSHSFRMGLFFLIAGFFSRMTFHRRGARTFVVSRLTRIAVPFLTGWFLLRPLLVALWIMGSASVAGDVQVLASLGTGFRTVVQSPGALFTGTHLWFLHYLLLSTAMLLAVRAVSVLSPRFHGAVTRRLDAAVGWITGSGPGWLVLGVPTAACLWHMRGWGMDTPDRSLLPDWPVLLVYSGFFSLGWLLHRREEFIGRFTRVTPGRVILCVLGVGTALALVRYQADPGNPRIGMIRAAFSLAYAVMMWSLVALCIGLFKRWLNRPSPVVRYFADASYWLYLVHLPVVVGLQIAVAELPMHWSLKLAGISYLTVGISILLYDLFVRSTALGALLNGRRRERVIFRRRPGTGVPGRMVRPGG